MNKIKADNLEIVDVIGDGNCLFRAISVSKHFTEDFHEQLRKQAAEIFIKKRHELVGVLYEDQDEFYQEYLKIKTPSKWVGETALNMVSEYLDTTI